MKPLTHFTSYVRLPAGFTHRRIRLSLAFIGLLSIVALASVWRPSPVLPAAPIERTRDTYTLAKAEGVPLSIEGVVAAAQATDIAARTSGAITSRPVAEGSRVTRGDVLAVVGQPQLAAERATLLAQIGKLDSERARAEATVEGSALLGMTGSVLTRRGESNTEELANAEVTHATRAVIAAMRTTYQSATEALHFLDKNAALTNRSVNELRVNAALDLGGTNRAPYLGQGVRTGGTQAGIADELQALEARGGSATPEAARALADRVLVSTGLVARAYEEAEREAYAQSSNASASEQSVYHTNRMALSAARSNLTAARTSLETALRGRSARTTSAASARVQADVEARTAGTLAARERDVTRTTRAELIARLRELDTALGEAVVRAPYSGTVTNVFVEVGQYVGPGTPLLHLESGGTPEVEILVSGTHAGTIPASSTVRYENNAQGVVLRSVERLDTAQGGAYVFATYEPKEGVLAPVSGTRVRGELILASVPTLDVTPAYFVPHTFVQFDFDGPAVHTEAGPLPVRIVRDTQTGMYIEAPKLSDGMILVR